MSPELTDAVDDYLASRTDCLRKTIETQRYRLERFASWARDEDVTTLSDLAEYDPDRYKTVCLNEDELAVTTVTNHLHTIRQFLRWANKTGRCDRDL